MASVSILGVDPGSRVAGYGLLQCGPGRRLEVLAQGAIRLDVGPLPQRLLALHRALETILATHRPDALAVETVFHGKSFPSALKLGQARGVVLLAAALHGVPVHEYTPAMVKKAVTGNGRASKQRVERLVVRLLGGKAAPGSTDASDALAVAYCHAMRLWRRRLEGDGDRRNVLRERLRDLRGQRGAK